VIRFPWMTGDFLVDVVSTNPHMQSEACQALVMEALKFKSYTHSRQQQMLWKKTKHNRYRPRNNTILENCSGNSKTFQVLQPSQFIKEIPHHLLNFQAIKSGQLPPQERALLQAERQEHSQEQGSERSMGCATATPKQIAYLHRLGCTVNPTSRLHASQLIDQYTERSTATPEQIAYLHRLGCTVNPTSRLHASELIDQYKKL
jgi:hypothetical protein